MANAQPKHVTAGLMITETVSDWNLRIGVSLELGASFPIRSLERKTNPRRPCDRVAEIKLGAAADGLL